MRHRPAIALLATLACLGGLLATGVAALVLPSALARDSTTLHGFTTLGTSTRVSALANLLAHSVDPIRYALIAAVLTAAALLRRRHRLALAVPVMMFCASASTELLKPLVGHPRYSEWLGGGGQVGVQSWPSGHATAAMMVALAAVLVAPPILRPLVALLGTGLAVGVSYSILVLGWHFPSDVLGGFFVAGGWVSLGVGGLWWAQNRWAQPRSGGRLEPASSPRADLLPAAGLLATTFGAAMIVLVLRGRLVENYGVAHLSFVAGALAIAGLAAMLATGMAVALRRRR